jgi:hypothetical protein
MLRRALICMLLVATVLALLPSAASACSEVTNPEEVFPIVPDATGVPLNGQLAIYYDVLPDPTLRCGLALTDMFFVLRLQKDGDAAPFGFAGSLKTNDTVAVCYEDSTSQIAAVMQFVQNNVVRFYFPPKTKNAKLPPVNLTAVSQIVQDNRTQAPPPFFMLMNVQFKVDTKK